MINYNDFVGGRVDTYIGRGGVMYDVMGKSSLSLSETARIASREKTLSEVGAKMTNGTYTEDDLVRLDAALSAIVAIAIPNLNEGEINAMPIGLKTKIIQAWAGSEAEVEKKRN